MTLLADINHKSYLCLNYLSITGQIVPALFAVARAVAEAAVVVFCIARSVFSPVLGDAVPFPAGAFAFVFVVLEAVAGFVAEAFADSAGSSVNLSAVVAGIAAEGEWHYRKCCPGLS